MPQYYLCITSILKHVQYARTIKVLYFRNSVQATYKQEVHNIRRVHKRVVLIVSIKSTQYEGWAHNYRLCSENKVLVERR